MQTPRIPSDEQERLLALKEYSLLDTESEQQFEEIVALASYISNVPISAITLIDEKRQWFKSEIGLGIKETPRDVSFCAHAILQNDLMLVADAANDRRFHDNPLVTGTPNIRFYAAMPLTTKEGYNLGTICIIDKRPRDLSPDQLSALTALRNQVLKLFELRRKNILLNKMERLHQKLFSIIGHDIRSPLNSIRGLLTMIKRGEMPSEEFTETIPHLLTIIDGTNTMLNNLLSWAVTQLDVRNVPDQKINLYSVTKDVIAPFSNLISEKNNHLSIDIDPQLTVVTNKNIIEFTLRNLVHNANKFTQNGSISVIARQEGKELHLTVADNGVGIPPGRISKIFEWGKSKSTKGTNAEVGSGLGMPMAKEFIEQTGGKISVSSRVGEGTEFKVVVPLAG